MPTMREVVNDYPTYYQMFVHELCNLDTVTLRFD